MMLTPSGEVVMVVIIGNGEKFGQFIIDKTDLS